jgi:phage-related protein
MKVKPIFLKITCCFYIVLKRTSILDRRFLPVHDKRYVTFKRDHVIRIWVGKNWRAFTFSVVLRTTTPPIKTNLQARPLFLARQIRPSASFIWSSPLDITQVVAVANIKTVSGPDTAVQVSRCWWCTCSPQFDQQSNLSSDNCINCNNSNCAVVTKCWIPPLPLFKNCRHVKNTQVRNQQPKQCKTTQNAWHKPLIDLARFHWKICTVSTFKMVLNDLNCFIYYQMNQTIY